MLTVVMMLLMGLWSVDGHLVIVVKAIVDNNDGKKVMMMMTMM